jgi:hypothetical protein
LPEYQPQKKLVNPPMLSTNQIAEFRCYWKTSPTQRDACRKYGIKPKQLKALLAQMDLQFFPSSRQQTTNALPAGDDQALAQRLKQKDSPRQSIASRFRPQGQTSLNPLR